MAVVEIRGNNKYPSQITYVLYNIEERSELIAALILAVHIVGNGDEMDAMLPKKYFRIETSLQIVATDPAHVLDQYCCDLSGFDVRHQLFPCGPVEVAAAPPVIRIMPDVTVAMLFGVAFEVAFLIYYGTGIPRQVIVAGEPLVQSGNLFLSLFHAH